LSNMSSSFFTDGNAFPSWEAQVSSIFHSGHIWFPPWHWSFSFLSSSKKTRVVMPLLLVTDSSGPS
jgi:hypothetical protein